MADLELEARIDALYRTPLEDFVAARKALNNDLKKAGKKDAAARVQALPKPNAVAYVLNRFFGERRADFDPILQAGQRVRDAFRATMSAAPGAAQDFTKAQRAQRETILDLVAVIRPFGDSVGAPLNGASVARLEESLLFISTTGRFGDGPPGRLIRELEPPGVEILADIQDPPPLASAAAPAARPAPAPAPPARPAAEIQASSVVANANEHVDPEVAAREAKEVATRAAEEAERQEKARLERARERKRAIAALDKELDELDDADQKLAKEVAPYRERASSARSLLHSCQTEHASLTAAKDELKTRIVRMEAEIARIDRAMTESEREIRAAEVPIAAADERARTLQSRRAELEAQRAALGDE